MPAKILFRENITSEVIRLYVDEFFNCCQIARNLHLKPHQVTTILKRNEIAIEKIEKKSNRKYRNLTDSTKDKISKSLLGKPSGRLGKSMSLRHKYNNIKSQLRMPTLKLEQYSNYDKLRFIFQWICPLRTSKTNDENYDYGQSYIEKFIEKFYNDEYFNELYDSWVNTNNNKLIRPTIDHIIPRARGGTNHLDNLQILSWFENRAKGDMTEEEWKLFKINHNITCDLFRLSDK